MSEDGRADQGQSKLMKRRNFDDKKLFTSSNLVGTRGMEIKSEKL